MKACTQAPTPKRRSFGRRHHRLTNSRKASKPASPVTWASYATRVSTASTSTMPLGLSSPSSSIHSTCRETASWARSRISSRVSPWVKQPGNSGNSGQ